MTHERRGLIKGFRPVAPRNIFGHLFISIPQGTFIESLQPQEFPQRQPQEFPQRRETDSLTVRI